MKQTKKAWAYAALFSVVLIWGLAPVISDSKWVSGQYSPGMLVACRGIIAAIALGIINFKKLKNINKEYFKVAVPTGIFLTAGYLTQMASYLYTTPAKSAFLENVNVIVIPIILYICTREKPTWSKVAACGICFVGMGIISFGDGGGFGKIGLGDGLAMLAGVFYGINIAGTGLYSKKLDSSLYVFIQISLLAVASLIYSLVIEGAVFHTIAISFQWQSVLAILFLALISTALCWVLRTSCFKHIPVVVVAVVMPFSGVVTGILSIALGVDAPTWNLLLGGVVVVGAILLAELGDALKKDKKEEKDGD